MIENKSPSAELDDAIEATDVAPDRLDAVRSAVVRVRDLDALIKDMTSRIDELSAERGQLLHERVPELLQEAGLPAVEIEKSGNLPAVRVEIKPFITANIAAKWPDEKRQAGIEYLESIGAADLIKTVITVRLPREQRDRARAICDDLLNQQLDVEITETVSSQTLAAWLRERVSRHEATKLDLIGGFVGRVAVMKELKK